jgi:hypothetical protein
MELFFSFSGKSSPLKRRATIPASHEKDIDRTTLFS